MPAPVDPQQVLYNKNYDKETQHNIEVAIPEMIKQMTGYCIDQGSAIITDASVVAAIMGRTEEILQWCKGLSYKYHEDLTEITIFENEISGSLMIDGPKTIAGLKAIQKQEIVLIAVKHKLMDKTMEKQPWEREVERKFFLNEIPIEKWIPHEIRLSKIRTPWKRKSFLESAYMVLKNGDIVKLISGINNSGKTWTSLPEAHQVNWYLRDYWAKLPPEALPPGVWEDLQLVKPFSMKRDVSYYPDPDAIRNKIADGTRFNTMPITEGMKAAINLQSWNQKVIDMILEIFTERASNNYISFEYQLTRRPPKMLLSRFNIWEHKPSQKWEVISMPSSVYRTEDPLLGKEIEKVKGDGAVSRWLTHKSGNVNFVAKMKAPKLKPRYDALFKKYRKGAKEEYEKGRKVKQSLGNEWYNKIAEYHSMVEEGRLAFIKIPDILKSRKLNDSQIGQFLRDYNKFDRIAKLSAPEPELDLEEGDAE